MSDIVISTGRYFGGEKKKGEEEVSVYTGPYTKFKLDSKEAGAEQLVVKTTREGKIIAVTYGDQILPFAVEQVQDRDRVQYYLDKYKRRLQGVILQILGEKPKGVS